ncbi:MAG: ABC-F family ATP-binding cassette domain-containing protein [Bryobacterales bacterium]|nr:ABC-F family ATP-binding cassette domain-containing protein [Bryobacterales bacterium]
MVPGPPILTVSGLSKSFGAQLLFRDIRFTVGEGARIGLIGPNGSGKSTLLQILAGLRDYDAGEVALRKRARLCYVAQDSLFAPGLTVRQVVDGGAAKSLDPESASHVPEILGRAGFTDLDQQVDALSGGWKKRLAIVEALVQHPDVLLLDEPTNHLDLAGIEWLEGMLSDVGTASIVVSHDRYFLENVTNVMIELSRAYPDGLLQVEGSYSRFLEKKSEFLAAQSKRQEALENRVRGEIEWLRRGAKARTRKSKARIDTANAMIGELADLETRSRSGTASIDFSATDRRTKRLVELEGAGIELGGRKLFGNLNLVVMPGTRIGLVGPNGSGKTTLLRLLVGEREPSEGIVKKADALRLVYFDQNRRLDPEVTLRRALAPDGDSIIYQDRVIHVAGWAARFLFNNEQLNQPVGRLSGGERARVLIAKLMLEPADVLLLDEPTNDLDIPTLEILEESLLEFPGALVLVTHDRYLLDRVSTTVLGLDGEGECGQFADYAQWSAWMAERRKKPDLDKAPAAAAPVAPPNPAAASKKKLSYLEQREFDGMEARIAAAEADLDAKRKAAEDPGIMSNGAALQAAYAAMQDAQKVVDGLYERWAELEAKLSG